MQVLNSSSKILSFLVDDILDFSQLKSGKFRKDISMFDLQRTIDEIVMILKYKAQ